MLDDDFAAAQFRHRHAGGNLRVTAAHEFFHAVQFAYDYDEDPWLMEATATWMEERVRRPTSTTTASTSRWSQLARP